MTQEEYNYFEILNMAAMKAECINADGTFVYNDEIVANTIKEEARKKSITFDEVSAKNEFTIEEPNIKIYSNYECFNTSFSQVLISQNIKKYYTYYNSKYKRLVILDCNDDKKPCSFYFAPIYELDNNIEYSMTNVFYWQKIYELLCESVCDETKTDRSFCINTFEKGRCSFEYSAYSENLNKKDLCNTYNRFLSVKELTKLYPMLLKNRCVERLPQFGESTLENLISELDEICNKVETDFAIFVGKIDFDSYIQKYNERLSEFVSQARNIIEKMLSNIFTLPLTYAGAIFAFDKLEDNTFAPFIFLAMCIYTLFSCGFLFYEFVDTFSLNRNFNKELSFYTNNSSILLEKIKPDIEVIKRRVLGIRIVCLFLILIFISLIIILGFKFFKN